MLGFWWGVLVYILIGFVLSLVLIIKFDCDGFNTAMPIFVIFLIIFFICMMHFGIGTDTLSSGDTIVKSELLSLNNQQSDNTTGSIIGNILFTYGQVQKSEKIFYRVIIGDETNGFQIKDIPVEDVYLFMLEENAEPYANVHQKVEVKKQKTNFIFGGLIRVGNEPRTEVEIIKYNMYIPKNAVKQIIEVDTSK